MYKVPCRNCNGKGKIAQFKHVEDGICFQCYGSGVQDATEVEYNEYKQEIERKKQGKYILFNKGSIEYYKTTKEITTKYGRFYSDSYGNYSVHSSYKDRNIVFTEYTNNSDNFINECNRVYNEIQEKEQKEFKEKLTKRITMYKEELKTETDQEFIEKLTNRISELEAMLA